MTRDLAVQELLEQKRARDEFLKTRKKSVLAAAKHNPFLRELATVYANEAAVLVAQRRALQTLLDTVEVPGKVRARIMLALEALL